MATLTRRIVKLNIHLPVFLVTLKVAMRGSGSYAFHRFPPFSNSNQSALVSFGSRPCSQRTAVG